MDGEFKIANSNHWVQVGGELYSNSLSRYSEEDRSRSRRSLRYKGQGYGVSLLYKYYLDPRRKGDRFYFITGPTFESFRFKYDGYVWAPFQEDGLVKYRRELQPLEDRLSNFSYSTAIGFQQYIFKYIFVDLYVGFGLKKAIFKSDVVKKENPFGNYLWDPGRTGTFPVVALRVGVLLF
jgi:hypothetical protein